MRQAILYARVSSKDQEREGYSIPAQLKFLREYAQNHELSVLREFVDVETAKISGRKHFGEMVRFLRDQGLRGPPGRKNHRGILGSQVREWRREEQTLLSSLRELEQAANPERALGRVRVLELANKAHSLYVTQTPGGKSEIAENGAIELRRGRGKCLSHLQKALRHDLRTG